jgi:hypothetical protein
MRFVEEPPRAAGRTVSLTRYRGAHFLAFFSAT